MKKRLLTTALVVAGFAAAALGAMAVIAVATDGSPSEHRRAVVLAASDHFAIYQVKAKRTDLDAGDYYDGDLYAISSSGKMRSLTTFTDGPPGLALVGDTLVQSKNHVTEQSNYYTVHYLDLATGQEGTVSLAPGDAELVAAPGGFVRGYRPGVTTSYGEVLNLELRSYSGGGTSLGSPYPDGRGYHLVAGDSGLIATTSASDEFPNLRAMVRYMSWSHPGAWKTIYHSPQAAYVDCSRPSTTSVACTVAGSKIRGGSMIGLIALDTGKAAWLTSSRPQTCRHVDLATYGSKLVAIETASGGACTTGRLIQFGADGEFATSARLYSSLGSIHVGLGKILVSSEQQRDIASLARVTEQPRVLARA